MFNPYFPYNVKKSDPFYYEGLGITSSINSVKTLIEEKGRFPLENIPVIILTAMNHKQLNFFTPEKEAQWQMYQKKLMKLSRNSQQIIIRGVDHFIQLERPDIIVHSISELMIAQK